MILMLAATALAAQQASVLSLTGSGTLSQADHPPQSLRVRMAVPVGATVCTQADSFATIRLAVSPDGLTHDDINLLAHTCVRIDAAWFKDDHRESHVSLQQGSLSVREAQTPGRVLVQTTASLTRGEAGGYRVTTEEDGTRTEALSQPVVVAAAGHEVQLAAGQGSRVLDGQAPGDPVDLLGPGRPILPDDGAPLRVPEFTWTPIDGAMGYRIEISSAADFSAILQVEEVRPPRWAPELLFLPYRVPGLWWRVSSFDRMGFLGVPSDSRQARFPAGVGP